MERTDAGTKPSQTTRAGATGLAVLTDLALVSAAAGLTLLLAMGSAGGAAAIRVPLGFLFVFFLPGYALISALFPRAAPGLLASDDRSSRGVSAFERVVLSVGLSLAIVPLLALGLIFVSQTIERGTVLSTIAGFTVFSALLGAVRRYRQPPSDRFHVSFRAMARRGLSYTTANRLNAALVLLVVLVIAGGGLAIASPGEPERYTEFGLLSEGEGGELTASAYPAELSTNESETLYLHVGNHERQTVEYTTVILLQRYEFGEIDETVELDRRTLTLAHGEERIVDHEIRPTTVGDRIRLTYLLYQDTVPADPTLENAYRSVSLTVAVTD
ncbi:DUF1616 domain-containing protein [Halovenus marina]|uniref:DUF1616 domain-containing protein n=1 Tax=Halovenus marina TaxID=3396621 RepID=UPI003F54899A